MGRAHPIELTNMCMLTRADGKVLVQNRIDPNWGGLTFPGGHVEPGESLVDSIVREMQEETGLTIRHPKLIGSKSWTQKDGIWYTAIYHPSALLRDTGKRPETFTDLLSIREKLKSL